MLYAASFGVLAGITALGIEVGDWYLSRNVMKNASDAAAMAVAIADGEARARGGTLTAGRDVAFHAARSAGFRGSIDDIQVGQPAEALVDHLPTAPRNLRQEVRDGGWQVSIREEKQMLFAKLLRSDALEINVASVAYAPDGNPGTTWPQCMVGLEATPGATSIRSNGAAFTMNAGCTVHANANMVVNGNNQSLANATISVGGTFTSGAVSPPNLTTGAERYRDPYADRPGITGFNPDDYACTHNNMRPIATPTAPIPTTYDARSAPGHVFVFCGNGTDFRSNTTFLGPALYIFKDSFDISNATVSGTDVTFILANMSPSNVRVTGNGTLNLIAPRAAVVQALPADYRAVMEPWIGIALFGHAQTFTGGTAFNPSSATFGGTFNLNVSGVVYTPGAGLNIQGNVSSNVPWTEEGLSCTRIIGRRVDVSGNVSLNNSDCGGTFGETNGPVASRPALYY